MFTINIYLKLGLIAVLTIGGMALAVFFGFWYAFPLFLGAVVLLVSYFLMGTIQSSAMLMQTMDFAGAEKRLGLTLFPKLLFGPNRAYYFLLKGTFAGQRKDNDEAEKYFLQAEATGLPTDNEKALVNLQLANLAASKNNWNKAQLYFKNCKDAKVTEPQLKEQIKQFEVALKNRGTMKLATQMGGKGMMFQPGGKRRRPRMR